MIREIDAKVLLSTVKQPDTWFGLKFNMNLYRGCQHQCIYCDSRSLCYGIENFADVLVKANAIALLKSELSRKRVKGTIGTGSMHDPYMPIEQKVDLTGRALRVIAQHHFPVHVITKSDLVLKDIDTLKDINRVYAAVSFTVTTCDHDLAGKVEPGAPAPTRRLQAMAELARAGIVTGIVMMPILPFLEDEEDNIRSIVHAAVDHGAQYIIPSLGMTLRDRQRAYYYQALDAHFPGIRAQYQETFQDQIFAPARNAARLELILSEACASVGLPMRMPTYASRQPDQLVLF